MLAYLEQRQDVHEHKQMDRDDDDARVHKYHCWLDASRAVMGENNAGVFTLG